MGPFWHVGPDQDHVPISGPTPNMVEKIRPTLVSLYSVAHTSSNFSLWQCTLGDLSTSTLMRYEIRFVELRKNIIRGNCRKLHNTPSSDHTLHYWVSQAGWKRRTHPPACDCPHLVAGFLALLLLWRLWLQQRNDPNNLLLNCSCVKISLFPPPWSHWSAPSSSSPPRCRWWCNASHRSPSGRFGKPRSQPSSDVRGISFKY